MSMRTLQVVWFKRDLRVTDHAPLLEAAERGMVLPLYVAETGYWILPDTSARQWQFIAETLAELRLALTALGQPLIIRQGDVVSLLKKLHARYTIAHLWSHEETGNAWTFSRDRAVGTFCREAGIAWTELPQFGVTRRLKDRERWAAGFETFMRRSILSPPDSLMPIPDIVAGPIPCAADLGLAPDMCLDPQVGGRSKALELTSSFFARRGRNYTFAMSSPLTAAESCSRLSAHLSAGNISMREIVQRAYQERRQLAAMPIENRSIPLRSVDSFIARLHWHCHFIQKLESEPEIERRAVHPLFEAHKLTTAPDDPSLVAWIEGRTGFPFLDACMRSLIATGWINFRMRAMLMAFASYHLALDWRVSGTRLAQLFTDYEPGIHWPQVQMQSGQTGINTPRIYNPVKQSIDQDKDGIFMRRWVPELAALPTAFLHEPWRMTGVEERMHNIQLGLDYPFRIVDHEDAARQARDRLSHVRSQIGFRSKAQAVFIKHGSRKRTLKDDHPARTKAILAKKTEQASRQMVLEF